MGKSYFEQIRELTKIVPVELVDFSQPRNMARIPTQATSDFGISFENILRIISNPDNEGPVFSVESKDARNQHKTTFKIKSKIGVEVASKVDEPQHKSVRKESRHDD